MAAILLRGSGGVKLSVALRAVRPVAVPGDAERFRAGRASCQPVTAALWTFAEQGLGAAERLASLLKVNDETARGIATYQEGLHWLGSLMAADNGPGATYLSIELTTSVLLLTAVTINSELNQIAPDSVAHEIGHGMQV